MLDAPTETDERKGWLGLMARAPGGRLTELATDSGIGRPFGLLRPPEIGSVMVRGRAGGTGAPFNLGEITVARCSLELEDGTVGRGYVQGRRKDDAQTAALVDALMQTNAADFVRRSVLDPLATEETARRSHRARKAASTKVEFFTLVRGED